MRIPGLPKAAAPFMLTVLVMAGSPQVQGQSSPYQQPAPVPMQYPQQAVPQYAPVQPGQPYAAPQGYAAPYGQPAQPYPGQPAGPQYAVPQGAWPQGQQPAPLAAPPVTFVDINSGRFGKLQINLQNGQFLDGAVDNLDLVAQNLDLAQGQLASLAIEFQGGHFQDFTVDRMSIATQGNLQFDTGVLLNQKVLQFTRPAQAQVSAVITQNSLNRFFNSPRTLDRLGVQASKKAAMLGSLLGANTNFGLSFQNANLALLAQNRVSVNMQTKLGVGELALPIPLELNSMLGLENGWVHLSDTHLNSGGQEISPDLSSAVVNKINSMANWGRQSDDIRFTFTELQVIPGDRFILRGTAEVNRLRFGRST